MRVLSLSYCDFMTSDDVNRHECSDRIWIPTRLFRTWMSEEEDVGSVVIVLLDGGKQTVAACVYGYHEDANNRIYAPAWMCEALGVNPDPFEDEEEDDDLIVMLRHRPSMCTSVKLQPFTSSHLQVVDETPEDALSRGFEAYTCLTEGQTLSLLLTNGETVTVTIVEAEPKSKTGLATPLCIRNTEVVLDLLLPLDAAVDAEVQLPPSAPMDSPVGLSFPGMPGTPTYPLRSVTPSPLSHEERDLRRALFAKAALQRFGDHKKN